MASFLTLPLRTASGDADHEPSSPPVGSLCSCSRCFAYLDDPASSYVNSYFRVSTRRPRQVHTSHGSASRDAARRGR
jgi:hypothetical protein